MKWIGGWLVAAALLGVAAPVRAQSLSTGLALWVPFEGTLEDQGPGGHHGVAVGSEVPAYAPDVTGSAASFDGSNDAVRFPTLPNSVFSGDFSIAWWMRIPAHANFAVLSKRSICNVGHAFDIHSSIDVPSRTRFEAISNNSSNLAVGSPLVPSEWVHIAVVRSGTTARVYTDSIAGTASAIEPMTLAGVSAPFGISISPCINFPSNGYVRFTGQIDELGVYTRALSAYEVGLLAGVYVFANGFEDTPLP
jgi:hypothetical protein